MKRRVSFRTALFFWFVAGMASQGTFASAREALRRGEREEVLRVSCSLQGGTLVRTPKGLRCLRCGS